MSVKIMSSLFLPSLLGLAASEFIEAGPVSDSGEDGPIMTCAMSGLPSVALPPERCRAWEAAARSLAEALSKAAAEGDDRCWANSGKV